MVEATMVEFLTKSRKLILPGEIDVLPAAMSSDGSLSPKTRPKLISVGSTGDNDEVFVKTRSGLVSAVLKTHKNGKIVKTSIMAIIDHIQNFVQLKGARLVIFVVIAALE